MTKDSSFVWLWPATELERYYNCASKKGLYVTVYSLTLSSKVPVTDSHIKEALHHTFRKVPSLRTCFRTRGDTLWACEMKREEINFQVTETQELVPAVEALLHYWFPTTEGPLWCARLFPASGPGRCCRLDMAAAFPHTRTLLLANHHGIADGTTNMFVTNAFLQVLDDVVAGKSVDDTVQVGKVVAGEETKAILEAKLEELMKEGRLQQVQEDIKQSRLREKLVPRAYPMPRDPDFKNEIIVQDLDQETTLNFIRKCKKEGVTVNSGLVAVLRGALVDFIREGDVEQDVYQIEDFHTVNMRRYWSGNTTGTLGIHMMILSISASTPAKWRDNFWDYARTVHKAFDQSLQRHDATMCMLDGKSPEEHFAMRSQQECDFGLANMGNIDRFYPTQGKQVRLGHLVRFTSCWNDSIYHFVNTLHGVLMYSLTYCNDILTRERAQKLVDKTFDALKEVIDM